MGLGRLRLVDIRPGDRLLRGAGVRLLLLGHVHGQSGGQGIALGDVRLRLGLKECVCITGVIVIALWSLLRDPGVLTCKRQGGHELDFWCHGVAGGLRCRGPVCCGPHDTGVFSPLLVPDPLVEGVGGGQGCSRRDRTSGVAPGAVRQAVGGGCQSGWGR